jgi:hypothetical protein
MKPLRTFLALLLAALAAVSAADAPPTKPAVNLTHQQLNSIPVYEEFEVWGKDEGRLWPYHVPGVLVTHQGTLLAWADGRFGGGGDFAPHHMVLKRSTDGGRSWNANQFLGRSEHGEIFLFGNAIQPRNTDRIHFFYTQKHPQDIHRRTLIWLRHSDDDGQTWSEPRELSGTLVERDRRLAEQIRSGTAGAPFVGDDPELYGRQQFYTGPGRIIQLRDDHSVAPGRLIVPVLAVKDRDEKERRDIASLLRRGQGNMVLVSDDDGQTWQAGGTVPMNKLPVSEPSIVELSDGRILMNSRVEKHDYRVVSTSIDAGMTWSKPARDTSGIPAYFETHSGLLSIPPPLGAPATQGVILFSFPNAATRSNLTVFLGRDDHRSWPVRKVIHKGPSYYSNMAAHAGYIYLIYGKDGSHAWLPERTVLARFNLAWLDQQ